MVPPRKESSSDKDLVADLRQKLSPGAKDLLFVVHSAAFEGVVHNRAMIEELVKEKEVEEDMPMLMQLFELTGILPEDNEK